ncbi:hypothetical protein HRED_03739 [Candidatus Haloredivivus sp. G17]|nr:hypothetical protein HRED_03739 [Candidatus Haloredivivus sp. G17]
MFYEEANRSDRTNLDEEEIKEGEVVLQFCQGDEGYIQGSRGSIKNDGYSDAEPLYPVIVIEEKLQQRLLRILKLVESSYKSA